MKKIILLAALVCFAALNVNAQEAESPIETGERLAKAADEAPQDWKKQFEAAGFYLNESKGVKNLTLAEKYATRALEIARSQTEMRDTILGRSLELMSVIGLCNNNIEQMMGYYDQAIRAFIDELGYKNAAIPPRIAFLASYKYILFSAGAYPYGDADAIRSLREAFNLNNQLPEGQKAEGMEDATTIYALSHEMLIFEQMQLMKDKMWAWTDKADGKTYIVLAFHDWTVDQPAGFMATMHYDKQYGKKESDYKYGFVLMDEQGNIIERKPEDFIFTVRFNQMGISYHLNDETNLRLASASDEKRQQVIKAFHKYTKKAKKNKK